MGAGGVFTYPLPERGEITVGRSVGCAICVEDARMSRQHARVRVGPAGVEIVDLGSSNGTYIGDTRLLPEEPVPLPIGEMVKAGAAMIVLQPASAAPRLRHLWSHGYFEARVEDECARARETGRPFAVARLRATVPARAMEAWLTEHLRPIDVVASYAPDEYEILLSEVDQRSAQGLAARLRAELAPLAEGRTQVGIACYPMHGRTPEELIARAAPARVEEGEGEKGADPASMRDPVPGGALDRLRPIVERVAGGAIPVLVVGETGVGKDVLASSIHKLSPRAEKPFVCVNCAALPEQLLESELFGYERGAFTGANQRKLGLLEVADGGTVFLDEIGELPLPVQAKLLRVLDQRELLRVGGLKPRKIDVRFVAATNRDLEVEVQRGTFREDLYYRLNAVVIVVPPLRERGGEIGPLARTFVTRAARELGLGREPSIGQAALELLERYPWPGNVRELRNVIERAVLLARDGSEIRIEHLPAEKMGRVLPARDSPRPLRAAASPPAEPKTSPILAPEERARVVAALEQCDGNQTHAARVLGVSRRTLITRMEAFGLPRPRKRVIDDDELTDPGHERVTVPPLPTGDD
ncbi:MAG TPA: sigma 54-interacting transcriptional regulator [Polyangiaceae bacterium]|jgi:DNA-binding NtrC family response regulator